MESIWSRDCYMEKREPLTRSIETEIAVVGAEGEDGYVYTREYQSALRASGELAQSLEVEPGADLICIRKRVLADSTPVIYSINYLPRALLGRQDYTKLDLSGSIFEVLERDCGQQVSSTVAHIKAACPDEAIRTAMQLDAGEAMLLLDEVCYTRLCRPVLRALSYYTNFFDFSILRKLI